MVSNANTSLAKNKLVEEPHAKARIWNKIKPFSELIASAICGILIVIGNVLEYFEIVKYVPIIFILAFVIGGYAKAKEGIISTIEEKHLNVELLMIFAAIGSAIIGYWNEGAILIFIFGVSGALESYTTNKSKKELSSLMSLQPDEAWLLQNDEEIRVDASSLLKGQHIIIKPGERVPADGKIIKGQTTIDESAITGESMPVQKTIDGAVFASTVNINGLVIVEVEKEAKDTLFNKILDLVQNAQNEKSPSQQFIERFESIYVNVVLLSVGIMMFLPHYVFGWSWNETFYRAMILLVVASPCALVASVMPATLSAISNNAKKGILIKGGSHLELLHQIRAIAFDKTGTLTKGEPTVTNYMFASIEEEATLFQLVASIEKQATHPLADAIVSFFTKKYNLPLITVDHLENHPGFGVTCSVNNRTYRVGKGAFIGDEHIERFNNGIGKKWANEGKTIVYFADEHEVLGVLALKDELRPETKRAIEGLHKLGVDCIMITGDSKQTALSIAKEAKIDSFFAECLPDDKVSCIHKIKEKYKHVAMIGDGINDAPAMATASVGIAMGEGTDVALETSDIVLMKNDLTKIQEAISISKRMNKIVMQNIVLSIGMISFLIISNFLGVVDLPFGVIGHEGSTILVILNGLRLLK